MYNVQANVCACACVCRPVPMHFSYYVGAGAQKYIH